MKLSIDEAKVHPDRVHWVKYRLRHVTVYQSPSGHCFTDRLDHADEIGPQAEEHTLSAAAQAYLRESLSGNLARIAAHVALVARHVPLRGARVLDVGSGTGATLAALRERGAQVEGLELESSKVLYARRTYGLDIHKVPLGARFWGERHARYDVITLWDVLEHLDFPARNLREAAALLKPGGYLMLDTPCRDGTFHRIGDATYAWSAGRYPTLLNLMYGAHKFGHKQILSIEEVRELLEQAGLEVVALERIHDLALPIEGYLRKLTHNARASRLLAAPVRALMRIAKPWNKVRAVARKRAACVVSES